MRRGWRALLGAGAVLLGSVLAVPGAWAQGANATPARPTDAVYTCIDDKGRRLTSDRPIPECTAKEQRILNRDGSLRGIHPPTLTPDERADKEARERRAAEQKAQQADAVRRDRNLMARYPNEEAHNRAREAALDTVRMAMRTSEMRLRELTAERKPLVEETEFYKGRALPQKLRGQLDANEAATGAQRAAMTNQEAELVRINKFYDAELDRLRRLWAGAPAGSLGLLQPAEGSAPQR